MDGVLIDSEPLWRQAEIETFATVGLPFTDDMCKLTMGMRLSEVIDYWFTRTPWEGKSKKEVEVELLERVTQLITEKGKAMNGVLSSLIYFKNKGYKIALASSSAISLINAVIDKLEIRSYFDVVNSAEFLNYGKPNPEIFIKTANDLNIKPINCLVIEDSFHGVLAAKAALMQTIAIPDNENKLNPKFIIADATLNDLSKIETVTFD